MRQILRPITTYTPCRWTTPPPPHPLPSSKLVRVRVRMRKRDPIGKRGEL